MLYHIKGMTSEKFDRMTIIEEQWWIKRLLTQMEKEQAAIEKVKGKK